MNPEIKNALVKTLGVKNVNSLRKLKWAALRPFIKDQNLIRDFYDTEIEIKVLEKLPCVPSLVVKKKKKMWNQKQ